MGESPRNSGHLVSGLAAASEALAECLTRGRKGMEGSPAQGLPKGHCLHSTGPFFRNLNCSIFQVPQGEEERNSIFELKGVDLSQLSRDDLTADGILHQLVVVKGGGMGLLKKSS